MRKVGYGLGLLAACMLLFALGVRVLTIGDIGPAIRPYYEACETMYDKPILWLVLSMGLAGAPLLQLFGGHCKGGERYAALALTVLGLVCAVGWAFLTVLHFVLL